MRLSRLSGLALGVLTLAVLLAGVSPASADWLIIPHLGSVFGGSTTIVDLDQGAGSKKFTFGGSAAWLSDGILGLEADVGMTPHFFEDESRLLVQESTVTTVSGNVIIAVPLVVSRESLRPYLIGGVGLMHASSSDIYDITSFDSNLLAMSLGGGAIGLITPRTGVRFDLRQFRNLTPDGSATTTSGSTRLSFWRASVGVVIRY